MRFFASLRMTVEKLSREKFLEIFDESRNSQDAQI
jgi:hypothetical protein